MPGPRSRGQVLLRADSGPDIGLGHAMRCLALAEELARRGFSLTLASHSLIGAEERVRMSGYALLRVSGPPRREVEAIRTRAGGHLLSPERTKPFRFVVLDHYMEGADDWLRHAESLARRRLVIDDVPGRRLSCELVVNPALGIEPDAYADFVTRRTRVLLGPRYAPLRRSLRPTPDQIIHGKRSRIESVLVAMGSGSSDATTLAVDAAREAVPQASIDVVVGVGAALARATGNVHIHVDPDDATLAALLAGADIALGAGGVSAYERCLAGLPSITTQVATNQAATIRGLAAAGAVLDAGESTSLTRARLVGMIRQLAGDRAARVSMSEKGRALVDGRGAERIAHELEGVRMRVPRPDDIGLLWRWSNDEEARLQSVSRQHIPWATHQRWFASAMIDPTTVLMIGHNNAGPVGQVRFEVRGDAAEVSIATDPAQRGTVGSVLLRSALRRFGRSHGARHRLTARVRHENLASRRVFESAGFHQTGEDAETLRYTLDPTDPRVGGGIS